MRQPCPLVAHTPLQVRGAAARPSARIMRPLGRRSRVDFSARPRARPILGTCGRRRAAHRSAATTPGTASWVTAKPRESCRSEMGAVRCPGSARASTDKSRALQRFLPARGHRRARLSSLEHDASLLGTVMVSARVSAMRRPRGVWQKVADLRKRAKPLGLGTQYPGWLRHICGTSEWGISDTPSSALTGRVQGHAMCSPGPTWRALCRPCRAMEFRTPTTPGPEGRDDAGFRRAFALAAAVHEVGVCLRSGSSAQKESSALRPRARGETRTGSATHSSAS